MKSVNLAPWDRILRIRSYEMRNYRYTKLRNIRDWSCLHSADSTDFLLGIQINSVRFPKDRSSCCEWFIVTADFGGFREVKYLLIIFKFISLWVSYKNLHFYCVEMSNFVLTKQHLREVLIFCFNWKKVIGEKCGWSPSNACRNLWWHCSNW